MSVMAAELVVITGAGAGIGRALARVLSAAGHPCLLISRHLDADLELEGKPFLIGNLMSDADALGTGSKMQKASTDQRDVLSITLE